MASAYKLDRASFEESTLQPQVVCLQPVSIVDNVCSVDHTLLVELIGGEDQFGGSRLVNLEQLQDILTRVGEYFSKAGGSAANTTRGLASLNVRAKLVGARGADEYGAIFAASMRRAGVDISGIRIKKASTGRCAVLSCSQTQQRTMRTCLEGVARLQAQELTLDDFSGSSYCYMSGYCFYTSGLVSRAIELAKEAGSKVAFDMGSYEIVRHFKEDINSLIESGSVDLCFCNEDEAKELVTSKNPDDALNYLANHCSIAIVTLGEKGCMVKSLDQGCVATLPAISGITAIDTTGAGDLFAAGFISSLLRGLPLQRAAEIGSLAGAAVVQTLGAEMSPVNVQWLHSRMHGELAGAVVRDSAQQVQNELLACYALIERMGRGVVYYGSARLKTDSVYWQRAVELGGAVAELLGCTTWSGGGPGMMQAASEGAMAAGYPVAGIRIQREAGTTIRSASYLKPEVAVVCKFLSARKVALVDAGVRMMEGDRTAYIFLPGGLGSCDELFELLTLMQLGKLGTKAPVPLIVVDWDGYWSGMMDFLLTCVKNKTVGATELKDVILAKTNQEVLDALAMSYGLIEDGLESPVIARASSWLANMVLPDANNQQYE